MMLSHYSREPVGPLYGKDQAPPGEAFKPHGLWVSVDGDDDWPQWCNENGYDGCGSYHYYRVHVGDLGRVLVLGTVGEIRDFDEQRVIRPHNILTSIDWEAVARDYAGIIIAPYQWGCRLDLMWYYGWDCASGCIWDPTVIERMELVSGPDGG